MIEDQEVGSQRRRLSFDLFEHTAADTGGFIYGRAFLADFTQHNSAGRLGQLFQFIQRYRCVVFAGIHRYQNGAFLFFFHFDHDFTPF